MDFKDLLLSLDLQYFAEGEEKQDDNQEQKQEGKEQEEVKTLTQAELDKLIQSHADKRVQQALETSKSKWEQEYKTKLEEEKKESERLAKMSAEERFKEELKKEKMTIEEERKQFLAEKAQFEKQALLLETTNILAEKKLPIKFANHVMRDTAEETMKAINDFEELWNSEVLKTSQSKVKEQLKGKELKKGNTDSGGFTYSKKEFSNLPMSKRIELSEKFPNEVEDLLKK